MIGSYHTVEVKEVLVEYHRLLAEDGMRLSKVVPKRLIRHRPPLISQNYFRKDESMIRGKTTMIPIHTLSNKGKGNAPLSLGVSKHVTKKKKRASYFGYDEQIKSMQERSDNLFEMDDELVSSSRGHILEDVMAVVKEMVAEGYMEEESPLWYFAISKLDYEEACKVLLSFTKH
ncbi:hypothetical protein V2J09_004043 [Rumex salicifolius]